MMFTRAIFIDSTYPHFLQSIRFIPVFLTGKTMLFTGLNAEF